MRKIKVPENYTYTGAFLTLRCNLGCSYCINNNDGVVRERKEASAEEWITALNRLETKLPITLDGGEPTLHEGFYSIIHGLENLRVDILTNLQFDVDEFIEKIDTEKLTNEERLAYKSIRASYHPQRMNPVETIEKIVKLQNAGFNIGLFAINHPESLIQNMEMTELARRNMVYFFIKDFLGFYDSRLFGYFKYPEGLDEKVKEGMCKTRELLIGPDLNVYRCHRDLYYKENSIGSMLDDWFEIEDIFRYCNKYGKCSPCDVKLKTNRFFDVGQCSVEIKPK